MAAVLPWYVQNNVDIVTKIELKQNKIVIVVEKALGAWAACLVAIFPGVFPYCL